MEKFLRFVGAVVIAAILAVSGFAGGVYFDRTAQATLPSAQTAGLKSSVSEVAGIIDREALYPVSETSLTAGAINGMVQSLEDSHAAYFDRKQYGMFNQETEGILYGIGITIANKGNDLVIMSVLDGTPAKAAGLKVKDVIVQINGKTRPRWASEEAVTLIRGAAGTKVTLGIRRGAETTLRNFTITRAKITLPNTETELIDGKVGYIRLYQFTEKAGGEVRSAVKSLGKKGAKGYILDLRDNPGGLLTSAVDVVSLFVKDGMVVRVETRTGTPEEYRASGNIETTAPLVVLINGDSASASEIVSGALQDFGRAKLIGEKSYGKGSVQQIEPLSFGGAIKLTIAHYLTPKHRMIDKIGLTPDVVVNMAPELQMKRATDTQLKRAVQVLEGELK